MREIKMMSAAVRGVLMNMYLAGIIKDDEDMIWASPYKDIIFHISRVENQIAYYRKNWGQYIIIIDIKNNLGTTITQLRFSELDAIRILDCMTQFTEWQSGSGESMIIQINPNTLQMFNQYIDLFRLPSIDAVDEEETIFRDIQLKINHYSVQHGLYVPLVTLNISDDELNDLIFKIFFVALLDVQMDPNNEIIVEQLASRIVIGPNHEEY